MNKLRILIADDHALFREGLKALVNAQTDMEVVGEADNGRAAWQKAKELIPNVVLMDVSMPEMNGVNATEILRRDCPDIRVLALTAYRDKSCLDQLLRSGVSGYVLKLSAAEELIEAIRAVAAGEFYLDREMSERISSNYIRKQCQKGAMELKELTVREEEVMRFIAQGYTNKEIAGQLNISVKTVETHKANLMEKLDFTSRTEIVRYAVRQGWLQDAWDPSAQSSEPQFR